MKINEIITESITFDGDDFFTKFGYIKLDESAVTEAEYQGRTVPLNKPMRGDVKTK